MKKKIKKILLSYYEPHVRALPKGKVNKPCEFGTKLRIDMCSTKLSPNCNKKRGGQAINILRIINSTKGIQQM